MLMLETFANAFAFAALSFSFVLVLSGFILRMRQINKSKLKIIQELREQITSNREEIFEMQRDFIALELKTYIKEPIVVMKNVLNPESEEKLPDISLRKKLLTKENAPEQGEIVSLGYNNLLSKQA
jgi:hypothetical protein